MRPDAPSTIWMTVAGAFSVKKIRTGNLHFLFSHLSQILNVHHQSIEPFLVDAVDTMIREIANWKQRSSKLRVGCTKYGGNNIEQLYEWSVLLFFTIKF